MKKFLLSFLILFSVQSFGQIKISSLPAMSGLCDTCKFPVVQSGITKKAGGNQIAWGLKGTTGSSSSHFLGTTDGQPLIVKTNGTERARILSSGNVGINTATPTNTLDVNGTIRIRTGASNGYILQSDVDGVGSWVAPSYWSLTGNLLTTPGTNFIGTSDAKDLIFKVNGVVAGLINQRMDGSEYRGSVAFGMGALNTSWQDNILCNIAIGPGSLTSYLPYTGGPSAGATVAIGRGSGRDNRTGYRNVFIGEYCAFQGWGGEHNVYVGPFAGEVMAGGSFNTGIGSNALRGIKQASGNTATGFFSLLWSTTGIGSVTINSGGTGWDPTPGATTVTFSSPDPASPGTVSQVATGTVTVSGGGVITGVTMVLQGQGYSNEKAPVTATFNGTGSGASATVNLVHASNNAGFGYAAGAFNILGTENTFFGVGSGMGIGNAAPSYYDIHSNFIGAYSSRSVSVGSTILTNATAIGYNSKVGCSSCMVLGGTGADLVRVGIGNDLPDASAMLDIVSTTQGLLPPRMTTAQRNAIASPATGLTLFCTDCTATDASTGVMQSYNGATWKNYW